MTRMIAAERQGAQRRGTQRLRVVVLAYLVRGPLGGMASSKLHYLTGLRSLGHDVYLLEDSDDFASCYDPVRDVMSEDPSYGLGFAARTLDRVGFGARWGYYDSHKSQWHGPLANRVPEICRSADVLLDVSGVTPIRPWFADIPVRVYIDQDPVFTQIKHLTDERARAHGRRHTHFFSFGENIASGQSTVPDDGFAWRRTRQPVDLDLIEASPGPASGTFTTIMLWDSYDAVEYQGVRYGLKSDSFAPYLDLPSRSPERFELAVGKESTPRDLLGRNGWKLRDPREPTKDPWTYFAYLRDSKAEFSVAKHGYVVANTGWFSERSAGYLASGRPVVLQDTGFRAWLPEERGVLSFTTPEEAVAAVADVDGRYQEHCRGAREIAADYFEAGRVLSELLEGAMA